MRANRAPQGREEAVVLWAEATTEDGAEGQGSPTEDEYSDGAGKHHPGNLAALDAGKEGQGWIFRSG